LCLNAVGDFQRVALESLQTFTTKMTKQHNIVLRLTSYWGLPYDYVIGLVLVVANKIWRAVSEPANFKSSENQSVAFNLDHAMGAHNLARLAQKID
jgi:hypothetical protein